MKEPPEGFDSVKGNTDGTDVCMIYQDANLKIYPMFLVYFNWR